MRKFVLLVLLGCGLFSLSASELLKTDNGLYINYSTILAFKDLSGNRCLIIIKNINGNYEKYHTNQNCMSTIKNNTVVPTLESTGRYLNLYADKLPAILKRLQNNMQKQDDATSSNLQTSDRLQSVTPADIKPQSKRKDTLSGVAESDNSVTVGAPATLSGIDANSRQ